MKLLKILLPAFFFGASLYGLPLRNPKEASLLSAGNCAPLLSCCNFGTDVIATGIGFYGDYVFDRHLKVRTPKWKRLDEARVNTNAALLSIDFWKRAELFTTLGGSNLSVRSRAASFGSAAPFDFIIETETKFSWSVGANAILWQCGPFTLGMEAHYFRFRPKIKSARFETLNLLYPPHAVRARYEEWQIGAAIAYTYCMTDETFFVPYIGCEGSHVSGDFGNFTFSDPFFTTFTVHTPHFRSDKDFGYAVGLTLDGCGQWELTAEARFLNEKACHIAAKFRF
jgi:major outer membrane protein